MVSCADFPCGTLSKWRCLTIVKFLTTVVPAWAWTAAITPGEVPFLNLTKISSSLDWAVAGGLPTIPELRLSAIALSPWGERVKSTLTGPPEYNTTVKARRNPNERMLIFHFFDLS